MRGGMAPQFRIYRPELADEIIERLTDGETLSAICRDAGMPTDGCVRGWVAADLHGFGSRYTRAREAGAWKWADEILTLSDAAKTSEETQAARLQVDTRKFLLAKLLPKVFGERVAVQHEGKIGLEALIGEAIGLTTPETAPPLLTHDPE